jgi:hypothetical protein
VETLLKEKNEPQDGVLLVSPIQNMETYLRFVGESGFLVCVKSYSLINTFFIVRLKLAKMVEFIRALSRF